METTDLYLEPAKYRSELLRSKEGRERFCKAAAEYVTDVSDASSFLNALIPPDHVKDEELVPVISEDQSLPDTYADGSAVGAVFFDKDDGVGFVSGGGMVEGRRYAITLMEESSETYERTEAELIAASYDFPRILEGTLSKERHLKQDKRFLMYCDLAVARTGKTIQISKDSKLSDIFRFAISPRKDGTTVSPSDVLLSEVAFTTLGDQLGIWSKDDIGPSQSIHLGGIRYLRSIKSNLFDTFVGDEIHKTEFYIFSALPAGLGHNVHLGRYAVQCAWDTDVFSFQGRERVGLGLSDASAITKVIIEY